MYRAWPGDHLRVHLQPGDESRRHVPELELVEGAELESVPGEVSKERGAALVEAFRLRVCSAS
jgi:hypothetical protein